MKHHCEKMETGEHLCFILKWLDTSGLGRSGGKRHWTNHKEAGGHQVFTLLLLQFLIVIVIVYIRTSGIFTLLLLQCFMVIVYIRTSGIYIVIVAIVSSLLLLFTSGWWSQESQRGFWTQTPTSPGLLISTLSSRYRQLCNFYSQQSQHSMC